MAKRKLRKAKTMKQAIAIGYSKGRKTKAKPVYKGVAGEIKLFKSGKSSPKGLKITKRKRKR